MGVLVVPPNKNGVLIGRARERLNRLEAASGCAADNPGGSATWDVRGSSVAHVQAFIQLAESEVYGAFGRVTDSGRVAVLADPAPPVRGDAVAAWRANNPVFFAEFPQATLVALASLTKRGPSVGRISALEFEPTGASDAVLRLFGQARGGNLDALFALANALETGSGVDLDRESALDLHLAAAKGGHIGSQFKAGMLHDPAYLEDEDDLAADLDDALAWYRKAAAGGHMEAMFNVSHLLLSKDEVFDIEEAERWAIAAVEAGHPRGEEQLRKVHEASEEAADTENPVAGDEARCECETLGSGERIVLDAEQLAAARVYVVTLPYYRSDDQVLLAFERSDGELQLPSVRQTEDESVELCIAQISDRLTTTFDRISCLPKVTYVVQMAGEPPLRIVVRTYLVLCSQRPALDPATCDFEWFTLDDVGTAPVRDIYVAPLAAAIGQLRAHHSPA
jgi:TPR repeat protein